MAREVQVTFDGADPGALAGFWCEALGYGLQPPPGFGTWPQPGAHGSGGGRPTAPDAL